MYIGSGRRQVHFGFDSHARRRDRVGHLASRGPCLAFERGGEGAIALREVVAELDRNRGAVGQSLRDHHERQFVADDRGVGFRIGVVF